VSSGRRPPSMMRALDGTELGRVRENEGHDERAAMTTRASRVDETGLGWPRTPLRTHPRTTRRSARRSQLFGGSVMGPAGRMSRAATAEPRLRPLCFRDPPPPRVPLRGTSLSTQKPRCFLAGEGSSLTNTNAVLRGRRYLANAALLPSCGPRFRCSAISANLDGIVPTMPAGGTLVAR
jgi:hypothetical protein